MFFFKRSGRGFHSLVDRIVTEVRLFLGGVAGKDNEKTKRRASLVKFCIFAAEIISNQSC